MAVSILPSIGFSLTIPDATTLVAVDDTTYGVDAVAVPSNCRVIVVYNTSTTDQVLIKFSEPSSITAGSMTSSNSIILPAASSRTFAIGFLGQRPELGSPEKVNLFLKAASGTSVVVNVSYDMGRGYSAV
jgi:hypothetical protein